MTRSTLLGALAGALVAAPVALVAVSLPHTFTNSQVADATQVNANFTALSGAIDAQGTRVGTLEGSAWTKGAGNALTYEAGNVGVGTPTPQATLDVNGTLALAGRATLGNRKSGSVSVQYSNGAWFNLFHSGDVGTGTYIVKVGPFSTNSRGGALYDETAVFLVSVHHGTNSGDVTAIPATFGGHAPNSRTMAFRLARTTAVADGKSYVQMSVSETLTSAAGIPWEAVRVF